MRPAQELIDLPPTGVADVDADASQHRVGGRTPRSRQHVSRATVAAVMVLVGAGTAAALHLGAGAAPAPRPAGRSMPVPARVTATATALTPARRPPTLPHRRIDLPAGTPWTGRGVSVPGSAPVVAADADGDTFVAREGQTVFVSTDGGGHWARLAFPHAPGAVAASGRTIWVVSSEYVGTPTTHVYRSDDGGASWATYTLPGVDATGAIATGADGAVLAAADGSRWRTRDGGARWRQSWPRHDLH